MPTRSELLADAKRARELGDNDLELTILRKVDQLSESESPALGRFLQGAGGEVLKAGGAIGGLIPGVGENNKLAQWGKEGLYKATGTAGEVGKFVGSTAPYFALPGSGIVRTAAEAGALSAATTPGDLSERAIKGAETGLLTGAVGAAVPVVSKVYDIASRPFTAKSNAAREILKEVDTALPRQAPSVLDGRDLSQGPPLPRFGRVPDAKATAGMLTDDPNILSLEMRARLRNPNDFFNRDNQNAAAIYRGLQEKAIPDIRANQMQDAVNASTGRIREEAFNAASQNPTYKDDLLNYVTQKYQEPGFRVSKGVKLLDDFKQGLLLKPKANVIDEAQGAAERAPQRPWHNSPVDTENDNMLTAITKLGGINKEMAQSTYGNRIWEDTPNGFNVFRNNGGQSLDDLSARLVEHGYLPPGSGPNDLVEAMYGNPREMYSHEKIDYGFSPEQGPDDFLRERLDSLISALSRKNAPKAKAEEKVLEVTALPEDIYQKRKDLASLLTLKTLAPDELTTVARGNRQATMDIINNIDDALNKSTGGRYGEYLAEHSQQMKPIEQGRAFQDILDKFETKPRIFGTDTPQITPAALRNAVDKETYVNLGKKGYVSNVGDTERSTLDDMIDLLNTTENAKKGTVATIGSPTATFATSLMQDGVRSATGSQIPFKIYLLLNALGVTRGKRVLDDALLNPEKLQSILEEANRIKSLPPVTQRNKTLIKLLQSSTAGAANE